MEYDGFIKYDGLIRNYLNENCGNNRFLYKYRNYIDEDSIFQRKRVYDCEEICHGTLRVKGKIVDFTEQMSKNKYIYVRNENLEVIEEVVSLKAEFGYESHGELQYLNNEYI